MPVCESARDLVIMQPIVALATAAPDGMPNVAPIFWKHCYDADTLLLFDNYMKTTKSNIMATGKASVSTWNTETGEAFQVKGPADYYSEGVYMDAAVAYMESQKPGARPKGVVVIRVEHVFTQKPGEHAGERLE